MSMDKRIPLIYLDGNGKSLKASLPLSCVNHVLIGLYVDKGRVPSSQTLYRVSALLLIFHEGRTYVKQCKRQRELVYWIHRLKKNACTIHYTSYDLRCAFHALKYVPIDFSTIPSTREDVVSSVVGTESMTADWDEWHCEKVYAEVEELYQAQTITRTRIAEVFSFVCLFVYNMLLGCFIFPLAPIHSSGVIEFTDMVIVMFLGMNVLLPMAFVFWRRFTRPFLTCIYTGLAFGGGLLGVVIALNLAIVPVAMKSLFIIYTFNFFLWTIGMIGMKLCKMALWFMRDWQFVR